MADRVPPSLISAASPVGSIPRARLVVLFMVMMVAAAGNTAMQSILPAIGATLGIADFWVSLAFSWSALLWVLTAPAWARQSDKRGRKRLMALGIGGFIASMLMGGLVLWAGLSGLIGAGLTFVVFALFRGVYGVFGSAAPPAVQAYVAARTETSERTRALSLLASSFGLGTVIGPTVAPWLVLPVLGLSGPLFVFALVGILVLATLRLVLPDDTPRFAARGLASDYPSATAGAPGPAEADDDQWDDAPPTERIGWTDPRVRKWNVAGLLGGHAQAMMLGVIGFLVLDRLLLRDTPELAAAPTGHVMWIGAAATLLAQWGLIPFLKLSPRVSVVVGCAIGGIGTLITGWGHSLPQITTGFAIAMLGFGLFRPGFTAGASLAVERRLQGQIAGQTTAINGAAYVVAPAVGVAIYNWNADVAFALMAIFALGTAVWGWRGLKDAG